MKRSSRATFVAGIASLFVLMLQGDIHAQPAKEASSAVRAAIDAANKKFGEGIAKRDAAIIASVYTEDALAFPAHSDVVKGKQELQKLWQSILDSGVASFELQTMDVETDGNLACESGTYMAKTKDGQVADQGKYCVVWKRVNGQWMLHRDIWTTSMPAMAAKSSEAAPAK